MTWRITVDSWINEDANWYASHTFFADADNLRDALRRVIELPAEELLDDDRMKLYNGKLDEAKEDLRVQRETRRRQREARGD